MTTDDPNIQGLVDTIIAHPQDVRTIDELKIALRSEKHRDDEYLRLRVPDLINAMIDTDSSSRQFLSLWTNFIVDNEYNCLLIARELSFKQWLFDQLKRHHHKEDQDEMIGLITLLFLRNFLYNATEQDKAAWFNIENNLVLIELNILSGEAKLVRIDVLSELLESGLLVFDGDKGIPYQTYQEFMLSYPSSFLLAQDPEDDDDELVGNYAKLITELTKNIKHDDGNQNSTELIDQLMNDLIAYNEATRHTQSLQKALFSIVGTISADTEFDLQANHVSLSSGGSYAVCANLIIMGNNVRDAKSKKFYTDRIEFVSKEWQNFIDVVVERDDQFDIALLQGIFFFKKVWCDSFTHLVLSQSGIDSFLKVMDLFLQDVVFNYFDRFIPILTGFIQTLTTNCSDVTLLIDGNNGLRIFEKLINAIAQTNKLEKQELARKLEDPLMTLISQLAVSHIEVIFEQQEYYGRRLIETVLKNGFNISSAQQQQNITLDYIFAKTKTIGILLNDPRFSSFLQDQNGNTLMALLLNNLLECFEAFQKQSQNESATNALQNNLKFIGATIINKHDQYDDDLKEIAERLVSL